MKYTDKEKEHIIHSFDLFCKRVIRNKAYEIHNRNKRYNKHFVSLEKSKRDIILMYYFTDLSLSDLACLIGYSNRTASYRHIQGLHLLRELMEADNE